MCKLAYKTVHRNQIIPLSVCTTTNVYKKKVSKIILIENYIRKIEKQHIRKRRR